MHVTETLGQVIREHRAAQGLSQATLGTLAGYGRGAAVSISRIEHGLTIPSSDRLAGIAAALRTTPEDLEEAAAKRAARLSKAPCGGGSSSARRESLAGRSKKVVEEIERREQLSETLAHEFDEAVDAAWDSFLTPLTKAAGRIDGAPTRPDKTKRSDLGDAKSEATFRRRFAARGVSHVFASTSITTARPGAGTVPALAASMAPSAGRAARHAAFKTAVAVGAASTGRPISELHGIAQTKAAQALIGGGPLAKGGSGIAGGVRRLNGVELAAAALVALTPSVIAAMRSVKKQREMAAGLDQMEAALAASRPGFDAAVDLLPVATQLLTKIAIHGGHSVKKWDAHVGKDPVRWDSLDRPIKLRYEAFLEIAGCQLAVEAIDFAEISESENAGERDRLLEFAHDVLSQSEDVVDGLA